MKSLKVMVLGCDGYIGWAVCCGLMARGHVVFGVDSGAKRSHYGLVGLSKPRGSLDPTLVPIATMEERRRMLNSPGGMVIGDIGQPYTLARALTMMAPDVIVHLAEQSSRNYGMTAEGGYETAMNNLGAMAWLVNTVNQVKFATPIIKVSTVSVAEPVRDTVTITQVAGEEYLETACAAFGLRGWLMRVGIVYGTYTPNTEPDGYQTRFDYDELWGNVVHRLLTAAVARHPMYVYGDGEQRVFPVSLSAVVAGITEICEEHCLGMSKGDFKKAILRSGAWSVSELAEAVVGVARTHDTDAEIERIDNPRGEESRHFGESDEYDLISTDESNLAEELDAMWAKVRPFRRHILPKFLVPTHRWSFR